MSMELLQRKICEKRTPAMVSLDLTPALLPPSVWNGGTVADLAAAYESWGKSVLDALADTIPAVKLHPVWFERLGSRGLDVVRTLCATPIPWGIMSCWRRAVRTIRQRRNCPPPPISAP